MQARSLVLWVSGMMVLTFSTVALAVDTPGKLVVVNAKSLKWVDAPPSLPRGAKVVTLQGDPTSKGPYVIRIQMPPRYKIPFHWQEQARRVTVVSGTLFVANTETFDRKIAIPVRAGGFIVVPARAQSFAFTKGKTIVEVDGEGPYDIKYTNPKDDPEMGVKGKTYYFPKEFEANELEMKGSGGEPIPSF